MKDQLQALFTITSRDIVADTGKEIEFSEKVAVPASTEDEGRKFICGGIHGIDASKIVLIKFDGIKA